LLPDRPLIATNISGGADLGTEAFQVAGRAKIMIVDSGASSCLSLGGLGFVELCLCHIGSVSAEASLVRIQAGVPTFLSPIPKCGRLLISTLFLRRKTSLPLHRSVHFDEVISMATPTNVLSSGIEITGSVRFANDMIVDGKIEGEITSDKGRVTIGENAIIKGDITAGEVKVYGKIEGKITSQRCELKDKSKINGDIKSKVFAMEEGAQLSGRTEIGG
jgi:cytoskeletal protein CcmA (bactofilin family)